MTFPIPSDLVSILRGARHVVVFTGAGVSAESGIPTFRDRMTGLWERYDLDDLVTPEGFQRDPGLVWGWHEWMRRSVLNARPNAAHRAIAALQALVPQVAVITQNVDDLHERAGTRSAIHLHGTLFAPRCSACETPYLSVAGDEMPMEDAGSLPPPSCPGCGAPVRPGTVWFGEELPAQAWAEAANAVVRCDLLFSVGTSSLVAPAAQLPAAARMLDTPVVQINPNPTELDEVAQFNLVGPAGEILPALVEAAWGLDVRSPS